MSEKNVMYDEFKGVNRATINVETAEGIVEAFAAAIGNKDSVGDIIVPGAFSKSLQRRKPRVVWGHDWNSPIGKILEIEEVPPTDDRIPPKMKAMGVGGLYVKVQFNLGAQRGKEAFNDVVFYGTEQEWSIGYKTLRKTYDPERQANVLHEVELYEVSPVLHGANNLTSTLSIKDASVDSISIEGNTMTGSTVENGTISWGNDTFKWDTNGTTSGSWDFQLNEVKTYGVMPEPTPEMRVRKALMTAFGPMSDVQMLDGGKCVFRKPDGMYMVKYRLDGPRLMVTRPQKVKISYVPVDEEPKPVMVEERSGHNDDEEPDMMRKRDFSSEEREEAADEGYALPDGSYPIKSVQDLKNAIQAYGRAKDKAAAKRHIIKRARALGETQLLPDSWDVMAKSLEDDMEEKAGRVISTSNMGKLQKAADMLQEVINSGVRPMGESMMQKKTLLAEYKSGEAGQEIDVVIRDTEWLTGKSVRLKSQDELPTMEKVEAMLDGLVPLAEKHDWAIIAPSYKSVEDGECSLEVMFSTEDNMEDQVKTLSEFLKSADCKVSVEVKTEDFYEKGIKHQFEEVFIPE